MSDFGNRLREERSRLKLNQVEFGELGGVSKNAQLNYEKGERSPDADYLMALIPHGIDVHYLLTGERAARPRSAPDDGRPHLLAMVQRLSPEQLGALEVVLKGLAKGAD